jgi:hypothetical protein
MADDSHLLRRIRIMRILIIFEEEIEAGALEVA